MKLNCGRMFWTFLSLSELHTTKWPRHSSSRYSLASHRSGPSSRPGLFKSDLWWTKWRWGRFSRSTYFGFPCQSSFSFLTITRGRYDRPEVPTCRVHPVWTPPPTMRIKKYFTYYTTIPRLHIFFGNLYKSAISGDIVHNVTRNRNKHPHDKYTK
jgi:hypothetical protein